MNETLDAANADARRRTREEAFAAASRVIRSRLDDEGTESL